MGMVRKILDLTVFPTNLRKSVLRIRAERFFCSIFCRKGTSSQKDEVYHGFFRVILRKKRPKQANFMPKALKLQFCTKCFT